MKYLLLGKSLNDAAACAGYSINTINAGASQALSLIRKKMPELMDDI